MLTSFLIRKRISPAIVNIQKAGFIVLRDEGEMRAANRRKVLGKYSVHFTDQEVMVLRSLLRKMDLHSEILSREPDSTDDEALPMAEINHHHKHHESLKEIFNKHGANPNSEFMRDLKSWKHAH